VAAAPCLSGNAVIKAWAEGAGIERSDRWRRRAGDKWAIDKQPELSEGLDEMVHMGTRHAGPDTVREPGLENGTG
jgi:hypothetical protein